MRILILLRKIFIIKMKFNIRKTKIKTKNFARNHILFSNKDYLKQME